MFNFEDNKELTEYEMSEIENRIIGRIPKFLKESPEAKTDYDKKTTSIGSNLMLASLTHFDLSIENEVAKSMSKIGANIYGADECTVSIDTLKDLFKSNLELDDAINMSAIVAFAIALTNNCVSEKMSNFILDEYEKTRKFYATKGETRYTSFIFSLEEMKHWVNEMALKEKVYTEIAQIEREPFQEEK